MTATIKAQETMFGTVLTIKAGRKGYPVSIQFSRYGAPLLVFGKSLTPIETPSRFGAWDTPKARRAYIREFVADWDDHQAAWDAIPCSDCGKPGDPCDCEA